MDDIRMTIRASRTKKGTEMKKTHEFEVAELT